MYYFSSSLISSVYALEIFSKMRVCLIFYIIHSWNLRIPNVKYKKALNIQDGFSKVSNKIIN